MSHHAVFHLIKTFPTKKMHFFAEAVIIIIIEVFFWVPEE